MIQLILHLFGDYVTQSEWVFQNKAKAHWPAILHATLYSLPFLLIGSVDAVLVIWGAHFLMSRYRLAKLVVRVKNVVGDRDFWINHNRHIRAFVYPKYDTPTGYSKGAPEWLSAWQLTACDSALHLVINCLALRSL